MGEIKNKKITDFEVNNEETDTRQSATNLSCSCARLVCIPNQTIVFFARSDWLLKLGIVSAIHVW